MVLMVGCRAESPDIEDMQQDLVDAGYTSLTIYDKVYNMDISSIEIEKAQEDEDVVNAYCILKMENEELAATVYYQLVYNYYDQGGWILDSCSFYQNSEIRPVVGVDQSTAEKEIAAQGSYESLTLTKEELDVEKGVDILYFDFVQNTETSTTTGNVAVTYAFENADWNYKSHTESDVKIEYHPLGQWRFDIYSYYVRVNILDIDEENQTVTLEYAGDSFQSSADTKEAEQCTVGYTITEEGMYIEPFYIDYYSFINGNSQKEIRLLVKRNDMYFYDEYTDYYNRVNWPRYVE